MKIIAYPDLPWAGRHYACPDCGLVLAFGPEDLKGVNPIKPRHEVGRWVARYQCPLCGVVRKFVEVSGVSDAPLAAAAPGGERNEPFEERLPVGGASLAQGEEA